jgi:tetratricopeptide (TPR) repeat protein
MQQGLAILRGEVGVADPFELAARQNDLGEVFMMAGDVASADRAFKEGFEEMCGAGVERHRIVASIFLNVGRLRQLQGDFQSAVRLFGSAAIIAEEVMGYDSPFHATAKALLGALYLTLGDYESAIIHLRDSWDIRCGCLGGSHVDTIVVANDLALAYLFSNQDDEAEVLLANCVAICERELTVKHLARPLVWNTVGMLCIKKGAFEEAADWLENALLFAEEICDQGHVLIQQIMKNQQKAGRREPWSACG